MTELIIESIPSSAEVRIDGEYVGTTPTTHTIGETPDLTMFRSKYLSGDNVSCSWDVLKPKLEDLTVSRLWWNLTRNERYSIAEMAIRNTLFHNIFYTRTGKSNCGGGEGELKRATCVNNAIIRCIKFGELPDTVPYWSQNADMCYYRKQPVNEEHCYVSNTPYKLPCYYVSMISEFAVNHAMAAIQIENNYDSLNSWIVFSTRVSMSNPVIDRCRITLLYVFLNHMGFNVVLRMEQESQNSTSKLSKHLYHRSANI